MNTVYLYPGTFSPPTYGHLYIVQEAASIFPKLIIICSENPNKNEVWFKPDECKALWMAYDLPKNVIVMTLLEFKALEIQKSKIVMIRGLRNSSDLEQETKVMILNKEQYDITKYLYIFGPNKNQDISSSQVRRDTISLNLNNLRNQVAPLIIPALLKRTKKFCKDYNDWRKNYVNYI